MEIDPNEAIKLAEMLVNHLMTNGHDFEFVPSYEQDVRTIFRSK